ncbi:182 kDa tankyrase-1-binding protein isoform X2 [Ovis aries]|uniref:Tankyrase 1 binding protein 1 n=1 Tax=Ovis aries TaxID=9940 RepID=A0AC11CZD2_SHEEP|nr:182 kDa tankyrase-1-binding protein isoform X2 [Ovis aries]
MQESAPREGAAMASPAPRQPDEELVSAGSEPGDHRAKPPVKPKPRALPGKPALPAKPSLLVPIGPRPPRGPLAELPSARKMNMLAGPQPYGGNKRPLPFAPRPAAEALAGGEGTREPGKEEPGKEETPPLTPPARCAAPGGVRKAPLPFRPAPERFAAPTVEEILAKMDQPRKEGPASPDRLWGSRLTFNHDGSSRYGPRSYGMAPGPRDDAGTLSKEWSQEGPAGSPADCPEEPSETPEQRKCPSDLAFNGDLAQPAISEPVTDVLKPWVPPGPGLTLENGGTPGLGLPTEALGSGPKSPHLDSLEGGSPLHPHRPEAQSPAAPRPPSLPPETLGSPAAGLPKEGSHHLPASPGVPAVAAPEAPRPGSPMVRELTGHSSPEQSPATAPQPLTEAGELPDLPRTFASGDGAAPGSEDRPAGGLAQRRFSEGLGVWRLDSPPPSPITEAAEAAEAAEAGDGAVSACEEAENWAASTREEAGGGAAEARDGATSTQEEPGGGAASTREEAGGGAAFTREDPGDWAVSTCEEAGGGAAEAVEARDGAVSTQEEAGGGATSICEEARDWPASTREEGVSQPGPGSPLAAEGPGRSASRGPGEDPGSSQSPVGGGEDHSLESSPTAGDPPGPALLQVEIHGEREPPPPAQEAALRVLEPVLGQEQPVPPDQPCVLFVDAPKPGQALSVEEDPLALALAETTRPRTAVQDPRRASPEPTGPESSSQWLDDLLASPPPTARRGAPSELKGAPTPSACSEGLLGWAQKDLRSEFGIAGGPHPGGLRPSTWSQDASRDYGLGVASPRGDPGLGERDWAGECGHGVGDGGPGEWPGRCALDREEGDREEGEVGGQDAGGAGAPAVLGAQDRVIGKPSAPQSHEVELQHWEFGKRDSRGTYSSRDAELQDQEFGKRDSRGTYSSRDAELQDQEFRKRDSLGTYSGRDAELQDQEFGKRDSLGTYSGRDASLQDWDFGKRDALGAYTSREEERQGPESGQKDLLGRYGGSQDSGQQGPGFGRSDFGRSAWVPDYSGGLPRDFGARALSAGFSLEEAQRQDTEFEKKTPGRVSPGAAGRDAGWPETAEAGGVFPTSGPQPQDGAPGQRDPGGWQGGATSREVGGLQAGGTRSPGEADREGAERGWAGDFGLGVGAQPEAAFGPGRRGWGGSFCGEAAERSPQFGIIGDDRAGGAGLSPCGQLGGGPFLPPEGAVDWTDQLGLRNLEVSSCVRAGGSGEVREDGVGQTGWAEHVGVTDAVLVHRPQSGGAEAPGRLGVGDQDWTSEDGGPSQAREGGVGQTDWSGTEAGEFLKSRERGVGQADWTPEQRDRELRPGGVDWGNSLGLRHLEVPCELDSESSQGPRGRGLDQVDWAQDSELRNVELPAEAPECGLGDLSQSPEPSVGNDDLSASGLEARGPSEARELGVGEMSRPDAEDGDPFLPPVVICPEEDGYGLQESPAFGPSPGDYLARSPPRGSQGQPGERLAAHSPEALALQELASPGPRTLSEEEGAAAGADRVEPWEPGRDPLPSWRLQPDGEASWTDAVDSTQDAAGARQGEQTPQGLPASTPSQDFSFIEDTEILDSAMYRSRANLGRKRGHRAPAIRPGGTLGLSEAAASDARLFQDSTEPRASQAPSSDEEVVEEPQNRRTRVTKGLKVSLFPGLSPSALKAKLRSRNRSADEGEPSEGKAGQKELMQRSKSCKGPGLGKPHALPPKPDKSSGSEGSSPNWLQALKLKKKKV